MVESGNGMAKAQQNREEGQAEAVPCAAAAHGLPPTWRCLSGWGVALVVSLLSVPAWRDYLSPEQGSLSVHGDLPSKPEVALLASASQERLGEGGATTQVVLPSAGLPPVIGAAQANEVSQSLPVLPVVRQGEEAKSPVGGATERAELSAPVQMASAVQIVDPALLAESEADLGVKKEEPVAAKEEVPVAVAAEPAKEEVPVAVAAESVKVDVPSAAEPVKEEVPAAAAEPVKEGVAAAAEPAKEAVPEAASRGETARAEEANRDKDGVPMTVPEVQPLRSAQAEKGLDSMYHAGRKAEPIPLDFHFALQVGSFQEREGALQRAGELRRKGYDAYVQESLDKRNGKQVWQSVRIGRFQDRKTAQNALELFKRKESGMAVFIASNDSYAEGGNKNKGATPAESTLVSRAAVQGGKESAVGPGKEAVPPVVVDKKEEIAPQAGKAVQEGAAEAKEVKSAPPQEEAAAAPGRRDREGGVRGDREAAEQLFQQSLAFRNNRDLEQEELALRQSLQKDGGHALARNRLARILVESKRVEEGLRLLQGAVQGRSAAVLVGEDSNLAAFLAALYQRQEEHVQAVELYEALLVRHPDKGIWRMGLAISLEKMGRTPPALAAYRQALSDSAMTPNLRRFVESRIEQLQ